MEQQSEEKRGAKKKKKSWGWSVANKSAIGMRKKNQALEKQIQNLGDENRTEKQRASSLVLRATLLGFLQTIQ